MREPGLLLREAPAPAIVGGGATMAGAGVAVPPEGGTVSHLAGAVQAQLDRAVAREPAGAGDDVRLARLGRFRRIQGRLADIDFDDQLVAHNLCIDVFHGVLQHCAGMIAGHPCRIAQNSGKTLYMSTPCHLTR